jgi:heme a synthase
MDKHNKLLRIWLIVGLIMVMIQVLLGGITRLTGSGLSITEWKPILGALYPNSEAEWQVAFAEYKKIAQFQFLNSDYELQQFKFIFFWEWLHRNWARFIGLVFFLPFVIFIFTKHINKQNASKYALLFVVGALQGLVGWIMVASGINDTNLYVNHFKLAAHFLTALIAFVLIWWYVLDLSKQNLQQVQISQASKNLVTTILILLVVQLGYGAFMAGLKAASAAPTWPSINGKILPEGMWQASMLSNPINVHFIHRGMAYLLAILVLVATIKLTKNGLRGFTLFAPVCLILVQICLGIASVLYSQQQVRNAMGVFEWNALAHQFVAMLLLMSLVNWAHSMRKKPSNVIEEGLVGM